MKKKIRILSHEEAKEEDLKYSLSLSPEERLRELQKLRILNYGKAATAPMVKKITWFK